MTDYLLSHYRQRTRASRSTLSLPPSSCSTTATRSPSSLATARRSRAGWTRCRSATVQARLEYLRKLAERRDAVKAEIASQGKLTDELSAATGRRDDAPGARGSLPPVQAEAPDRAPPWRASAGWSRWRRPVARRRMRKARPGSGCGRVRRPSRCPTSAAALAGARDIIAEQVSDDPATRLLARQRFAADGFVASQRASERPTRRAATASTTTSAARCARCSRTSGWRCHAAGRGRQPEGARSRRPDADIAGATGAPVDTDAGQPRRRAGAAGHRGRLRAAAAAVGRARGERPAGRVSRTTTPSRSSPPTCATCCCSRPCASGA